MKYSSGFTLIELLVVMAIIGTLLAVVAPKYFRSMDHANETALRHDLTVMREAIGHFYQDQNRYPSQLAELVFKGYLRAIPVDPITGSDQTWLVVSPADAAPGTVYDVVSGSEKLALDGTPYQQY